MKKTTLKIVLVATAFLALAVLFAIPPVRKLATSIIVSVLEWTQSLGIWGPLVFIGLYIAACVFMIPGSPLTIGAGFVFKIVLGTIAVSVASTLGSLAAFLIGRSLARNWVQKKVSGNVKIVAIDEALGRQGFKIVLLTRLSPVVPFSLINYGFSVTRVKTWQYVLGSWIGMLPGTLMYVYIGAGLRSLSQVAAGEVERGLAGRIFFWFGMTATVVVTVFITMLARRTLNRIVETKPDNTNDGEE